MTILDKIVEDTRRRVERARREVPVSALEKRPFFHSPTLAFGDALRADGLAFITEIKKASPSKGVLRREYDVAEIARDYKLNGSTALSVLTEPTFFQGSLDHLALARQTVDLPILRKDFIVDPYQLVEARAYGADAVLLIASVLERRQLYDLHQAASELGLACLVELYDLSELDRVDFDQVRILGVNNRDLRTFEVDIDHSLRVFAHAPAEVTKISESGLRTARELAHLYRHGVHGVLIGETFMRAASPGEELRGLRTALEEVLREPRTPLRKVS